MYSYKFPNELSLKIVKGILTGYKSYLQERKLKKETMKISSAYAWVKGNHIESAIANECLSVIDYKSSKAGYSWGYLQFIIQDYKVLFIIRNTTSLLKRNSILTKQSIDDKINYLVELSKINIDLKFPDETANNTVRYYQPSFLDPLDLLPFEEIMEEEIEKIKNQFDRFYIVSYSLDETKAISEINLLLPVPGLTNYLQVDNWTHLINQTGVEISSDELESVSDEKGPEKQVADGDYGFETSVNIDAAEDGK